jgi:hypothetical protein
MQIYADSGITLVLEEKQDQDFKKWEQPACASLSANRRRTVRIEIFNLQIPAIKYFDTLCRLGRGGGQTRHRRGTQ